VQGGKDGKAASQCLDLVVAIHFRRSVEEDAEAPVAAVFEQYADLVADLGLRQEFGDVAPSLGLVVGEALQRHDARPAFAPPIGVEGIEDIIGVEVSAHHLVGIAPMLDEFRLACGGIAGDGDQIRRHDGADHVDQPIDMDIGTGGADCLSQGRPEILAAHVVV